MDHPPITVHRISPSGGRRVTISVRGVDTVLGVAQTDRDVIEFLRRLGVPDPDEIVLGDSPMIRWQGGPPHVYDEAPPG
ncbi:hypothetical protein OG264_16020 [Streptomyces xanthophaeus]|uniref:hypothetical protein n=1 Tax=Streptomyces xanthophaeus TaxID=67385 RepID=UPI00386BFDA9|nr:hypothetical protein OG264_16020 [Streptomyces xanthophaeus]WST62159.1 hypothetical protein OG605_22415 [Streptomyces xanthophaeus]